VAGVAAATDPGELGIAPAGTGGKDRADYDFKDAQSIHGETAAKRRAVTELRFSASVGDLARCQRIARLWKLKVGDPACCDYDKRTPLHLAASEGCYKVTEWLLSQGAAANALDRFRRTPLEDAARGEFTEVAKLLIGKGGQVWQDGALVPFADSALGRAAHLPLDPGFALDPDWEIDPATLVLQGKLGEGEFGVVHRALWHGTAVAAKVLKASTAIALGDFRAEIEVLRRVHHPNAVQFLGACTKTTPYILVTELMCGGSVADALRPGPAGSSGGFSPRRALEVALDTARGLAYMHARKQGAIVHRDLKPGNLMVGGSPYLATGRLVGDAGTVKLADFGLSKSLPKADKHAGYDLDSKFKLTGETGSYRYMAPEVFRHEPYNKQVDVYSFSMIAYQLFEHVPPFAGEDPVEAARQAALFDRRPPLRVLGGEGGGSSKAWAGPVRRVIEQCWDPDPERRPTFEEVVVSLERVLAKVPRPDGGGGGGGGCACVVQ
jgi:hypothetical protein